VRKRLRQQMTTTLIVTHVLQTNQNAPSVYLNFPERGKEKKESSKQTKREGVFSFRYDRFGKFSQQSSTSANDDDD